MGYVIKNYKRGADLELLIKSEEDDFTKATGLNEPTMTDEEAESKANTIRYEKLLDRYFARLDVYKENKENTNCIKIVHYVIRKEWFSVKRYTIFIFKFLNINTIRII